MSQHLSITLSQSTDKAQAQLSAFCLFTSAPIISYESSAASLLVAAWTRESWQGRDLPLAQQRVLV